MGPRIFALVLSGLLFGGAGIALGRASERSTPVATPAGLEECAVVSLPAPASSAPVTEVAPRVVEPSVDRPTGDAVATGTDAAPSEPGAPRVRRLVVTSGVEGHEPVDDLDEVRVGAGRLYAFVDAANAGGATSLEVTFEHERSGRTVGHVELGVPAHARRHRTWAYTTGIRNEGLWYAVVRDARGAEVARTPFEVIAAE